MTTRRIAAQSFPTRGGRIGRASCRPSTRRWRRRSPAPYVAAALRQDRHERRERRRLRQGAQTARSRSPRPRAEEVLFPEDWPSPNEEVGAPPGNFEVPGPATPPGMRFLATSAKYGGVPTLPSSSSGSSRSVPESELRALRRASRAAASDAAWQEEDEEPPAPPPRRAPRCPAGAVRPPGLTPPQPAPRTRTEPAPSPSARTEPAPPPPARTRSKFPRGHPFHTGPRLLHLPLEMRWEPVPGS